LLEILKTIEPQYTEEVDFCKLFLETLNSKTENPENEDDYTEVLD